MSGQVSLTVENVFMENNIFQECVLDVYGEDDVFGNRLELVLPRMMYLLDNNNFQTALYFNRFCMLTFFEHGWDGFCGERLFLDWCRFVEYWML